MHAVVFVARIGWVCNQVDKLIFSGTATGVLSIVKKVIVGTRGNLL